MLHEADATRMEVRAAVEWLRAHYPGLEDDETAWLDTIEGETNLVEAVERMIERAINCKTMVAALNERAADIAARKKRLADQERALRGAVLLLMEEANLHKMELPEVTLSVRKVKPKLVITDEDAVPDDLCSFTRKVDMAAVKDAFASAPECFAVDGVAWDNGGASLTVRTK